MRTALLGAVLAASLAGCGDDGGNQVRLDGGPCWPLPATPGGQIELGTGDIHFEPLPATMNVVKSSVQSDPFLIINALMSGLPPGNVQNPFDPKNPHTKITVEIPDLGWTLGVQCPGSLAYVPTSQSGMYEMSSSAHMGFGTNPVDMADGKQAKITIEIVGSNGLYAKDEKTVMLTVGPGVARELP